MDVPDELRNYWSDFDQILYLSVIWSNLKDGIVFINIIDHNLFLLQIKYS